MNNKNRIFIAGRKRGMTVDQVRAHCAALGIKPSTREVPVVRSFGVALDGDGRYVPARDNRDLRDCTRAQADDAIACMDVM